MDIGSICSDLRGSLERKIFAYVDLSQGSSLSRPPKLRVLWLPDFLALHIVYPKLHSYRDGKQHWDTGHRELPVVGIYLEPSQDLLLQFQTWKCWDMLLTIRGLSSLLLKVRLTSLKFLLTFWPWTHIAWIEGLFFFMYFGFLFGMEGD